jgi:hypothetical protein
MSGPVTYLETVNNFKFYTLLFQYHISEDNVFSLSELLSLLDLFLPEAWSKNFLF